MRTNPCFQAAKVRDATQANSKNPTPSGPVRFPCERKAGAEGNQQDGQHHEGSSRVPQRGPDVDSERGIVASDGGQGVQRGTPGGYRNSCLIPHQPARKTPAKNRWHAQRQVAPPTQPQIQRDQEDPAGSDDKERDFGHGTEPCQRRGDQGAPGQPGLIFEETKEAPG